MVRVYTEAQREAARKRSSIWRKDNPDKTKKLLKDWYSRNKSKSISQSYAWRHKNIDSYRAMKRKWNAKNKEKIYAHKAVSLALKAGEIIKPTLCSSCLLGRKLYAHHDDYNKQLSVVWLCYQCHSELHKKRREQIGYQVHQSP